VPLHAAVDAELDVPLIVSDAVAVDAKLAACDFIQAGLGHPRYCPCMEDSRAQFV
jgi:hypothetical protein